MIEAPKLADEVSWVIKFDIHFMSTHVIVVHCWWMIGPYWSYIDIKQPKAINFITPQMKNKQQQQTKDPDTCWRRLRFYLYLCETGRESDWFVSCSSPLRHVYGIYIIGLPRSLVWRLKKRSAEVPYAHCSNFDTVAEAAGLCYTLCVSSRCSIWLNWRARDAP